MEHLFPVEIEDRFRGKRVALLYGGESAEREISLLTGQAIGAALERRGIEVVYFDWKAARAAELISGGFDAVYVALHGGAGENGELQGLLEIAELPYTGSGVLASALAMDKLRSKLLAQALEIPTAPFACWSREETAKAIREGREAPLPFPLVVKPTHEGSSVGVSIVHDPAKFTKALEDALVGDGETLFERYVPGKETTVAVVHGHALGVCEIVPGEEFYDFEAKYKRTDTKYLVPSTVQPLEPEMMKLASKMYEALGCKGIARIDFLVEGEQAYLLEVNTVPGMTEKSLVPKIAAYRGIDFDTLCVWSLEGVGR